MYKHVHFTLVNILFSSLCCRKQSKTRFIFRLYFKQSMQVLSKGQKVALVALHVASVILRFGALLM